jgi:hypothetical protein
MTVQDLRMIHMPPKGLVRFNEQVSMPGLDYVAALIRRSGPIEVAGSGKAAGLGAAPTPISARYDVMQGTWTTVSDQDLVPEAWPQMTEALERAAVRINGGFEALTTGHRRIASIPRRYFPEPALPSPPARPAGEGSIKSWRRTHAEWTSKILRIHNIELFHPQPHCCTLFDLAMEGVGQLDRPVDMRWSLSAESEDARLVVDLVAPPTLRHGSLSLFVTEAALKIDPKASLDAERHRLHVLHSAALSFVRAVGAYVTDPGMEVVVRLIEGDPQDVAPMQSESRISIGGGDWFETVARSARTSAADLQLVPGVAVEKR